MPYSFTREWRGAARIESEAARGPFAKVEARETASSL
jgi:hypothetical protein